MRIEGYTPIQAYTSQKITRGQATAKKGSTDQVQISSLGLDMQTATAAVKGASDIRYDKVEPLKTAVQNGTYNVDSESFADKLLQKYEELR